MVLYYIKLMNLFFHFPLLLINLKNEWLKWNIKLSENWSYTILIHFFFTSHFYLWNYQLKWNMNVSESWSYTILIHFFLHFPLLVNKWSRTFVSFSFLFIHKSFLMSPILYCLHLRFCTFLRFLERWKRELKRVWTQSGSVSWLL